RALSAGRLAALGATLAFHHGLLAPCKVRRIQASGACRGPRDPNSSAERGDLRIWESSRKPQISQRRWTTESRGDLRDFSGLRRVGCGKSVHVVGAGRAHFRYDDLVRFLDLLTRLCHATPPAAS